MLCRMENALRIMKQHHLQVRCLEQLLDLCNLGSISATMQELRGVLDQLGRWFTEGQYVLHDYSHVSCLVDAVLDTLPKAKVAAIQRWRDGRL
jgi:hypothetical protein